MGVFDNFKDGDSIVGIKKFKYSADFEVIGSECTLDKKDWEYAYGTILKKEGVPTEFYNESVGIIEGQIIETTLYVFWYDEPETANLELSHMYWEEEYSPEYFEIKLRSEHESH